MSDQGEIIGLFPSVLARKSWNEGEKYNESMKSLFLKLEKEYPMPNKELTNYYTSYNIALDKHLIEYNEMKPFVSFLSDCIKELNSFMGFDGTYNFKIRDMWFAINRQHSYHEIHNHSPAIWSGVYYVQANKDDAPLKFYNPSTFANSWANNVITEYTDFNTPQTMFQPSTNTLNIFPGYLLHSVEQQQNNNERIAISFNVV